MRLARPVYAPALVAFVAASALVVGLSHPWRPDCSYVALGPNEPFYPAYRIDPSYLDALGGGVPAAHRQGPAPEGAYAPGTSALGQPLGRPPRLW